MKLWGRRNGKADLLEKQRATQPEIIDEAAEWPKPEGPPAVVPAEVVEAQEAFERQQKATQHRCPHKIARHRQVPHPRYGAAVPHFVTWIEPLAEAHHCVDNVFVTVGGKARRLLTERQLARR